jgi:hypothetical protein
MQLHYYSLFRGSLRLELTATSLKCERTRFSNRHSFEVPHAEVSATVEQVEQAGALQYVLAVGCLLLPMIGYALDPEISIANFIFGGFALYFAGAFFYSARVRSGSYTILRSTRESSRDIWILRSGRESEVDAFVEKLCAAIAANSKPPNKAPL